MIQPPPNFPYRSTNLASSAKAPETSAAAAAGDQRDGLLTVAEIAVGIKTHASVAYDQQQQQQQQQQLHRARMGTAANNPTFALPKYTTPSTSSSMAVFNSGRPDGSSMSSEWPGTSSAAAMAEAHAQLALPAAPKESFAIKAPNGMSTIELLEMECKVCGDRASGVHYGVYSCEGCKGFFRRTIHKQISYRQCVDGNCDITKTNRNKCQACRIRKCMEVGMSKDAVKYGRIPKTQKARLIAERLAAKMRMNQNDRAAYIQSDDVVNGSIPHDASEAGKSAAAASASHAGNPQIPSSLVELNLYPPPPPPGDAAAAAMMGGGGGSWQWQSHRDNAGDAVHPLSQMRKMVDENYQPRNPATHDEAAASKDGVFPWKQEHHHESPMRGAEQHQHQQHHRGNEEEPLCLTKRPSTPSRAAVSQASQSAAEMAGSPELISFRPYRREANGMMKEHHHQEHVFPPGGGKSAKKTSPPNPNVMYKDTRPCFQPWLAGTSIMARQNRPSMHPYNATILQRFRTSVPYASVAAPAQKRLKNPFHLPNFAVQQRLSSNYPLPGEASPSSSARHAASPAVASDVPSTSKEVVPHGEDHPDSMAVVPVGDPVQHRPKSSSSYDSGCQDVSNGGNGSDGSSNTLKRKLSEDEPEDLSISAVVVHSPLSFEDSVTRAHLKSLESDMSSFTLLNFYIKGCFEQRVNNNDASGNSNYLNDEVMFQRAVLDVVDFARKIPGFDNLPYEDMMILLNEGTYEVLLVRMTLFYERTRRRMRIKGGSHSVDKLQIEKGEHYSCAEQFVQLCYDFCFTFTSFDLTDRDLSLFTALILFATDRPGLQGVDIVKEVNNQVLDCLERSMSTQPGGSKTLLRLMLKLAELRTLSTKFKELHG